jgi:hypothetical protein
MTGLQPTRITKLGVATMTCVLLSLSLSPKVNAAALNPPPPPGSTCQSAGNGTICRASFPFLTPAFDTGLSCAGFEVLESDAGTQVFTGYYDSSGNAIKWVFHFNQNADDGNNQLVNSVNGSSVPFDEHFTATASQFDPVSGTFGVVTQTGLALRVALPGQGLVLQDVGKVVFDPDSGTLIEQHGSYDTFSGDIQNLCAALT